MEKVGKGGERREMEMTGRRRGRVEKRGAWNMRKGRRNERGRGRKKEENEGKGKKRRGEERRHRRTGREDV